MQHEQDSKNWLIRAKSDLALARITLPEDVLYSDLCFHAQQSVEKCVKAVLIHRGIEFRRVHDIAFLLGLLPTDIALPPEAADAASLTTYAVTLRYPGEYEEITDEMCREAIRIAEAIFAWAEQIIIEERA